MASLLKRLIVFAAVFSMTASARERVAILGDSITYGGRWPALVESALRGTPEFIEADIVNFGLGSETLSGLSEPRHAGGKFPRPCLHERLGRILETYRPTMVLACYGMNDGIYLPSDPERTKAWRDGVLKLKDAVETSGARIVFITPPLHEADKAPGGADRYDAVLDSYADWLVARRNDGWSVIDIRPDLRKNIAAAKLKDSSFIYAKDNVHPGDAGHDFIAASVAKQLWTILQPSAPLQFAEGEGLSILLKRAEILKLAWLSKSRHLRPGIPQGLPVEQADKEAEQLMDQFRHSAGPVSTSDWKGYERLDFRLGGRNALLVKPKSPAPGRPWIWRTEFFGHQPQADLALLEKGWHVGWIDLQNLYGAPCAMPPMDAFHSHLTSRYGLSSKTVLFGFSRGGLFAFNWASLHPDKTAGIYVDAPVCDIKSWPGGKGTSPGAPADWKRLLQVYDFTEAEALVYQKNPIDRLAPLAAAKVPVFAVVGQADKDVPVAENIDVIETRYRSMGGDISIIRKPDCAHHPHSLPDPAPIVEFVLRTTR